MNPDKAFILAAGLGTRMKPLTDTLPKPMVAVHAKPMIDHALDALWNVGVKTCVINTHYKAEVLNEHLKHRAKPEIILSHEPVLLDTGGGIAKTLPHFDAPFFVLSGDSLWENAPGHNTLLDLAAHWDSKKMDILILLQPMETMKLTEAVGDYNLMPDGRAVRSLNRTGRTMFTSIRINAPSIFASAPHGAFSYLQLLDQAEKNGRLYGLIHTGLWHHISTPADVDAVNTAHG